jgi:hypothetical protein
MHVQCAGGTPPRPAHVTQSKTHGQCPHAHVNSHSRTFLCGVSDTHSFHPLFTHYTTRACHPRSIQLIASMPDARTHVRVWHHLTTDPSNSLPQHPLHAHTSGFGILFSTDWECSAYADSVRKARAHPPSEGFALAHAAAEGHSSEGWGIFDPMAEYERLGLPDSKWRLSTVNENYSVCPR